MRLIDANALYEQTAEWEARALSVIEKKNLKPFDEMDINEIVELRKWSCILEERSAFKHDVFDAPTIDAVPVVRCKDCIHSTSQVSDDEDNYYCNVMMRCMHSLEYCSHGERKES